MSKSYVYVVVYCSENKTCLVAEKERRGYFFNKKRIENKAGQILNYSGQDVFPGGQLNERELPKAGAAREFEEETGVTIQQAIQASSTLKSFGDGEIFTNNETAKALFHCVYVKLSKEALAQVVIDINNRLINTLEKKFKCVSDDELKEVFIVPYEHKSSRDALKTFVETRADIHYGHRSRDKGWFDMIMNQIP